MGKPDIIFLVLLEEVYVYLEERWGDGRERLKCKVQRTEGRQKVKWEWINLAIRRRNVGVWQYMMLIYGMEAKTKDLWASLF